MHTRSTSRLVRRSPKNITLALFLAGSAALSLTACSGSGDHKTDSEPTPSRHTTSPSASTDPQAEAKQEVLGTYREFWAAQTKAYAQANVSGTDLKKYATADALSRAEGDILSLQRAGVVTEGQPKSSPQVTALALQKKVPAATITDCLDISGWRQVEKKTGKDVPRNNALTRYVTVVSAEKWGKQWMILKVDPQQRSC
ncbi:hypothetical protein [Streptomyces yunnanensis]|uniref:Secreted protein/lipoprotein n=1 Tax=Streptomyces yunnanensis TaxID=156453 RepID=A0A9X8N8Y1_9ACTN|nr:hypothetical protein [Streptomyces yunnanensis]SHN30914.1 hypothetical protein SAMN05216268_13328 [Streptomyces yunnanensis]